MPVPVPVFISRNSCWTSCAKPAPSAGRDSSSSRTQTRFVTRKALAQGLRPIVVVNKVDRDGARPDWVVNHTFDLFDKLGASEEQLDFPVVYASALEGWATLKPGERGSDLRPLLETILERVPAPRDVDTDGPLQLQISALDWSSYVGRIGVGRIRRGRLRPTDQVMVHIPGKPPMLAKVNQVFGFRDWNGSRSRKPSPAILRSSPASTRSPSAARCATPSTPSRCPRQRWTSRPSPCISR